MRKRGAIRILPAIFAAAVLAGSATAARKLNPVDEGPKDASFLAFRNQLIAAVKRHDLQFIHRSLDPHVTSSFGDEATIAVFKRTYESKNAQGDLWKALSAALSLGGQFQEKDRFCAPYVFTGWPDGVDMAEHQAIIGKNVRVRAQPNETAPVVDTLSYDIVKVDLAGSVPPNSPHRTWIKITTPGGRNGYVSAQHIRGGMDYRACFQKRSGRWWLTILVAGD